MANSLKEHQKRIQQIRQTFIGYIKNWVQESNLSPFHKQGMMSAMTVASIEEMVKCVSGNLPINRFDDKEGSFFTQSYVSDDEENSVMVRCSHILNAVHYLLRLESLFTPIPCEIDLSKIKLAKMQADDALRQAGMDDDTQEVFEQYKEKGTISLNNLQQGITYNSRELKRVESECTMRKEDIKQVFRELEMVSIVAYPLEPHTGLKSFFYNSNWQAMWLCLSQQLLKVSIQKASPQESERALQTFMQPVALQYSVEQFEERYQTAKSEAEDALRALEKLLTAKHSRTDVSFKIKNERSLDDPLRNGEGFRRQFTLWSRSMHFPLGFFPVVLPQLPVTQRPDLLEERQGDELEVNDPTFQ